MIRDVREIILLSAIKLRGGFNGESRRRTDSGVGVCEPAWGSGQSGGCSSQNNRGLCARQRVCSPISRGRQAAAERVPGSVCTGWIAACDLEQERGSVSSAFGGDAGCRRPGKIVAVSREAREGHGESLRARRIEGDCFGTHRGDAGIGESEKKPFTAKDAKKTRKSARRKSTERGPAL